jgi:hypothetical protein
MTAETTEDDEKEQARHCKWTMWRSCVFLHHAGTSRAQGIRSLQQVRKLRVGDYCQCCQMGQAVTELEMIRQYATTT